MVGQIKENYTLFFGKKKKILQYFEQQA